jgi:hypothetical protein
VVSAIRISNGPSPWVPGLAPQAPYSSRLSARSALYTDLRLLLDDREHALTSDHYRSLVVEENCLARGSMWARQKLWKELHSPYRKKPEDRPKGWAPDLDDGVKVNIEPLQKAGVLRLARVM